MDYSNRSRVGLSNQEITRLGKVAREAPKAEDRLAAKQELVKRFLGLAIDDAKKRSKRLSESGWKTERDKELESEIIQWGMLGLCHAAETYNPDRGSFKSWVSLQIKHFTTRGMATRWNLLHLSSQAKEQLRDVLTAREAMAEDGNHNPSASELADFVGLTEERVVQVVRAGAAGWADYDSIDLKLLGEGDGIDEILDQLEVEEIIGGTPLEDEFRDWAETDRGGRGLKRITRKAEALIDEPQES